MSCIKNKVICFKAVDPDTSDFFSFSREFCFASNGDSQIFECFIRQIVFLAIAIFKTNFTLSDNVYVYAFCFDLGCNSPILKIKSY